MNIYTRSLLFVAGSASLAIAGVADATITGAGSTFVYPVLSKWASDFKKAGGLELIGGKRLVGRAEIDGARLDLRDSAARSDRLVIDFVPAPLLEVGCPF